MRNRKKYIVFGLIVLIGVAFDQLTKMLAVRNLKNVYDYNPDAFFTFTYAENDGAFLSLGSGLPDGLRLVLLTIVPGVLLLAVMVYMLRSRKLGMVENIVFALIAAGGIGNIIDRILEGKVVDFMHMHFGLFQTGIFNVADLYIVFGIVIYVFAYLLGRRNSEEEPTDGTPAEPGQ